MGALNRQLQNEPTKKQSRSRRRWPCELCLQQASVYCPWDEARLCDLCDAKVHSANFLVARHSRHPLCPCCGELALQNVYTGPRIEPCRPPRKPCVQCTLLANACQQQQVDVEAALSSQSCCVDAADEDVASSASTHSPPKRRLRSPLSRPHSTSSSAYTAPLSQEEGLGDSEDGSYHLGSSQCSPPRSRRRLLP